MPISARRQATPGHRFRKLPLTLPRPSLGRNSTPSLSHAHTFSLSYRPRTATWNHSSDLYTRYFTRHFSFRVRVQNKTPLSYICVHSLLRKAASRLKTLNLRNTRSEVWESPYYCSRERRERIFIENQFCVMIRHSACAHSRIFCRRHPLLCINSQICGRLAIFRNALMRMALLLRHFTLMVFPSTSVCTRIHNASSIGQDVFFYCVILIVTKWHC